LLIPELWTYKQQLPSAVFRLFIPLSSECSLV
jgi:hypothetical protein